MDFGLSDEQRLLQRTFQDWLAEHAPITRVRELSESKTAERELRELWRRLAELGAAGVLIPESYGGSGLGLLDAALIAEEFGRAAAPLPFLGSAVLAPVALMEAGSEEQRRNLLPRLASGELLIGVAATETYSVREGAGVRATGDRLSGKSLFAIDLPGADWLLVAAGRRDLFLVDASAAGVEIEELRTVDRTRRVAEVRLADVQPHARIGEPSGAGPAIERMLDAGRAILAADTVGAAESMLDQAVAYAKQRKQFDRVIASFQAVKHLCAEIAAELEPTRSLFWYAAHAFDGVRGEAALVIAHAKCRADEMGRFAARTATEVHGGIGFTDEQNLHVWFKRIGLNGQLLGGPDALRERAAALQGWAA